MKTKGNIAYFVMLFFMVSTTLIPLSIANKLVFAILLFWAFVTLLRADLFAKSFVSSAIVVNGIFLYGYFISFANVCDQQLAKQFVFTALILFLIQLIINYGINLNKASESVGQLMLAVTFGSFLLDKYPNIPFSQYFLEYITAMNQLATSERDYLGERNINTIALSTAPFFYVPLCVVVFRMQRGFNWVDMMKILLYVGAIVVSGSRGLIVASVLIITIAYFKKGSMRSKVAILFFILLLAVQVVPFIINQTKIFSQDEVSNKTKIGHFLGYIDQLTWINTLFGNGLGSFYYSFGKDDWVPHTELTPVDLARYVGIPLSLIVFGVMIYPNAIGKQYNRRSEIFRIAFLIYLGLSMTNPVLINSAGMLVVLWYWSNSYDKPVNSGV